MNLPTINELSKEIANLISAGEVVERPSSVVKELVENAIDAGSSNIEVELTDGGIKKIKVIDNGIGMKQEEIPIALSPHATSKIKCQEDLFNIDTLGPLPSVDILAVWDEKNPSGLLPKLLKLLPEG